MRSCVSVADNEVLFSNMPNTQLKAATTSSSTTPERCTPSPIQRGYDSLSARIHVLLACRGFLPFVLFCPLEIALFSFLFALRCLQLSCRRQMIYYLLREKEDRIFWPIQCCIIFYLVNVEITRSHPWTIVETILITVHKLTKKTKVMSLQMFLLQIYLFLLFSCNE